MIAPLRRRHRAVFTLLALLLPVGLVAALRARPSFDTFEPGDATQGALAVDGLEAPLVAVLSEDVLELRALIDPKVPNLLVYHSQLAPPGAGLPPDARLLGALPGTRPTSFELGSSAGVLLFYDLGHSTLLGSLPLSEVR